MHISLIICIIVTLHIFVEIPKNKQTNKQIPQYEIDEHTIGRLDQLRRRHEEQDRLTNAVIADYTQKAKEYRAESKDIL